jgi:hypothetical protein
MQQHNEDARKLIDYTVACAASENGSTTRCNEMTVTVELSMLPDGVSAAEARAIGIDVPENIPDCALYVLRRRAFEWVDVYITCNRPVEHIDLDISF